MDLLAVVTIEERVEVYRISGQRAFGLQRKIQDVKVESICWKYNGSFSVPSESRGSTLERRVSIL
jgi:anaphase-promoting complex subunit 4